MHAMEEGYRASLVFLVQRMDANAVSVNDDTDPGFAKAIRWAMARGLEVYAYSSKFEEDRVILQDRLKVEI